MSDAVDIIRAAMQAASSSSLVLDFGTRPGLAVGLVHNLRSAGVNLTWDGATLTIPLAELKSPITIGGHGEPIRRALVSAQLTLLDAALVHADTGDDHQWLPGEDIAADIDAVLAYVPDLGKRHRDAHEKAHRPLALLYVRTALLGPDERKVAQGIARRVTGFVDSGDGVQHSTELIRIDGTNRLVSMPTQRAIWVRVSGEASTGTGRVASRHVSAGDRAYVWRLEFRHGADSKAKAWRDQVREPLRALGCAPAKRAHILLPSLAPLILALRWSPALEAAVFLAGSGVAPKSDEWAMLVDQALMRGLPWAVPLAELSARHPRDVLSRAIAWVHAQGMYRRAGW
jgi:hypothetical protein